MDRGDRIFDFGTEVTFWPMTLAEKLPRGILRFIGMIAGIPLSLVAGLPVAAPILLFGIAVSFWDFCNER